MSVHDKSEANNSQIRRHQQEYISDLSAKSETSQVANVATATISAVAPTLPILTQAAPLVPTPSQDTFNYTTVTYNRRTESQTGPVPGFSVGPAFDSSSDFTSIDLGLWYSHQDIQQQALPHLPARRSRSQPPRPDSQSVFPETESRAREMNMRFALLSYCL